MAVCGVSRGGLQSVSGSGNELQFVRVYRMFPRYRAWWSTDAGGRAALCSVFA